MSSLRFMEFADSIVGQTSTFVSKYLIGVSGTCKYLAH